MNFNVLHAATNNRFVNGDDIWLNNLALIALFNNFKITSSSGKYLKNIDHAHLVSLMYKLLTSGRGSDGLSIGFGRDRNGRQGELTDNKNVEGKYHVRLFLKDIFGFAEMQEKTIYGHGYELTLTRNTDNAVLNKTIATNIGKVKRNCIEWYVPHYTASLEQQTIVSQQIVIKTPTELQYIEISVFKKEINTRNSWSFELGTQDGIKISIMTIIGFQQRGRQDSQNLAYDAFYIDLQ